MKDDRHVRGVSCLALTFFYDYVEAHGHSRHEIQEGLPYSPEYLDNRTNWIDYETFLEIERRMARLFPDPSLFYEIGLTFGATKGFGFLRPIFRSVLSPYQLYSLLPRLVPRFLFPFVTIRFQRVGPERVHGTYSFEEGFPPSDAFYDVVRGLLTSVPVMMGGPPALVHIEKETPLRAAVDIRLSHEWSGALGFARNMRRRIVATGRMLWTSAEDAASELEETNRLLQEKVDALTEAKGQLDRKVRQLSILNAVAQTAASELELTRLVEKVTSVISRELGGTPTAVLLAEGEPEQLVIAASAQADGRMLQTLRSTSLEEVLKREPFTILHAPGERLLVMRMARGDTLIAALALALEEDAEHDVPFIESLTGQLAVAIDNALAYQTISDLHDNLEVRVRERTAELEEARGQLEDTVDRLRRSDRARNEFFTNVSHELRTPLTLILAPLDALEASLQHASPVAKAHLRSIRENSQALLRLINEILDFAKIDAERMPLSPAQADFAQLVEDTVATLRPLADRKGVQLTFERPQEEITAWFDPRLTRRVVMNLVGNAVKYVEPGQSILVVAGADQETATLEVTDTGPGIPREYQARIFERFQRVPDASGRTIEGSGIGLAMVKEIVQLHHGHIEVESEPGHGATFRIFLPRTALVSTPAAAQPAAPVPDEFNAFVESLTPAVQAVPLQQPGQPTASEERLLIVEDNDEMRSFLQRLFGDRYQLFLARDGQEGLEKARAELPNAIVSDVMMPRLDGYELCRRLKADPVTRSIPVILVSARHGTEAALEGFAAGADDFVVKPFSAPELLARVSAQIRIRSLSLALLRMEKQTTLGLMAAGIAHEVLNPVNAVVNAVPPLRRSLELVRKGREEEAHTAELLLGSVERSGWRIQNVVRAILAFSRQDRGELRLRPMKVSEGVESTLSILQFRIHDAVTIHQEYEWDGAIDCYPDLLNQLLMNLLVNALDALGPKGGNIWIREERSGDSVVLRVRDDGPGVSPQLRERIFDPFFTTKPVGKGTGLGLPLAREIVSLHDGSIELGTGPEGGAEFTVTLPVEPAVAERPILAEARA